MISMPAKSAKRYNTTTIIKRIFSFTCAKCERLRTLEKVVDSFFLIVFRSTKFFLVFLCDQLSRIEISIS